MTVLPGKAMHSLLLFYGITRMWQSKLWKWSRMLGAALSELQQLSPRLEFPGIPCKEVDLASVEQKARNIPFLVEACLDKLVTTQGELLDRVPQRLAHGDLSAQNILVDGNNLAVVDWGYASIRSVFHDPLHLARCLVFSQERGVARHIAIGMATELLTTWMRTSDLPFSGSELATVLKLELCRAYCADGIAGRILSKRPRLTADLTSLVCGLTV
jgi:hypothetical protein